MNRPAVTHVLPTEGGSWKEFSYGYHETIHAIRFDNGDEWDCYNGWRPKVVKVNYEKLRGWFKEMDDAEFELVIKEVRV